jgi:hypothetical protein
VSDGWAQVVLAEKVEHVRALAMAT